MYDLSTQLSDHDLFMYKYVEERFVPFTVFRSYYN